MSTTRRKLLLSSAWATLGAGVILAGRLVGAAISRRPRPSRRLVQAGPLASLQEGGQLSAEGVILIRDERGIAAVSSRCTHLGCTITPNARGFECNCHGSMFARDGRVIRGPATSALPWYQVMLGDDGQIMVDLDEIVPPSSRLIPGGAR